MGSSLRKVLDGSTELMLAHFVLICVFSILYLLLPAKVLSIILGIAMILLMLWTAVAFVMSMIGIAKYISDKVDLMMIMYEKYTKI